MDRPELIRQAARRARKHRPAWLDTTDMVQEAELGLLAAEARGRIETAEDPDHLANRTRLRAFGYMVDAIEIGMRKSVPCVGSYDDTSFGDLADGVAVDDPERAYELKQAAERVLRKATPQMRRVLGLLAGGLMVEEVATAMELSAARVSQLRTEARQLLGLWS